MQSKEHFHLTEAIYKIFPFGELRYEVNILNNDVSTSTSNYRRFSLEFVAGISWVGFSEMWYEYTHFKS